MRGGLEHEGELEGLRDKFAAILQVHHVVSRERLCVCMCVSVRVRVRVRVRE